MTHWLDPQAIDVPAALREVTGGHPSTSSGQALVAETLARRGILTAEAARAFLGPSFYTPAPPTDLPDLARAVERIRYALGRAIRDREQIAVWGDFDADGQTATALLLEGLRALGARVTFHIPGRGEGHGLHVPSLERLIGEGARLILTCDTGITAHREVARAHQLGAEVIITDHHVLSESLPPAVATINPHRLPSQAHPLAPLVGVGVAYQLVRGLNPAVAERALDLVALGTVADVGELTGDNRYLVQRGLEALRDTDRPGLLAVYEAADLHPEGLSEEHIGFVLGPRLNALGRLDDAAKGVELLTTADSTRARILATEVEGLNAQRQWLTKQVTDAALAQVEREPALLRDYHALVLSHPTWPGGVVGIVAGRLAERFGKPAVLISTPPGEIARASGRSVPGVDLIAALTDCAPLLEGFGGHPGAAGFGIEPERIPELRAALSRAVATRAADIPEPTLQIDAYVELPDLTLDLVADINRLAPFGRGNPPLTLAVRDLRVLSEATIGRTEEHRRLTVEDAQDHTQTVFWWQGAGLPLPEGRFDLALTLRASDYRGETEVQVEWLDAREREVDRVSLPGKPAPAIEVCDYRGISNAEAVLRGLAAEGNLQVWAEGTALVGVPARTRQQLVPGPRLAIWTLPPGPQELRQALGQVRPQEVFLFAHDPSATLRAGPGPDEAKAFLQQLAGLVKYALQARAGRVELEALAAALAHRASTVQAGLRCLIGLGQIVIVDRADDTWQLAPGSGQRAAYTVNAAYTHLSVFLAETAAYRAYLRRLPAASLAALVR
jgi:single-stranded-DNA-specific exonuclease